VREQKAAAHRTDAMHPEGRPAFTTEKPSAASFPLPPVIVLILVKVIFPPPAFWATEVPRLKNLSPFSMIVTP
jgi:hypothetical protein